MLLCEEYLKRHDLPLKFIRHVNRNGNLFFKNTSKNSKHNPWTILHIAHEKERDSPGFYRLDFLKPCHNVLYPYIYSQINTVSFSWDEYEKTLGSYGHDHDYGKPVPANKLKFICWEMFLYCCDYTLSNLKDKKVDLLYNPLNTKISIKKRHEALDMALKYLSTYHSSSSLYATWAEGIIPYTFNYCDWLIEYF